MKRFLLLLTGFSALIAGIILFVLSRTDGEDDPFYLRFCSPRQESLILGTSRSAQGLVPAVIKPRLNGRDIFNYSFTLAHSPYGEVYLSSIRRKLNPETRNGIFILAVDPWSLSCIEGESAPREEGRMLDNQYFVNLNPNFEYLLRNFHKPYMTLLEEGEKEMTLHPDGWLEVTIPMDSASVEKRALVKLRNYSEYAEIYYLCKYRFEYLEKTVRFLKNHGSVYLIRLPVSPAMLEIEEGAFPGFNREIQALSSNLGIPYWDLASLGVNCTFTDGNHLYRESAIQVSELIGEKMGDMEKTGMK